MQQHICKYIRVEVTWSSFIVSTNCLTESCRQACIDARTLGD
jgi:hypothetical protein